MNMRETGKKQEFYRGRGRSDVQSALAGQPATPAVELMRQVAEAAAPYERRWTLNALKRVDPDLHQRLIEQRDLWHTASVTGSDAEMLEQGQAMCRGWAAATRAMEASGEPDDAYLLGQAGNGLKVAIGHQKAAIGRVQELHGDKVVWMTPDEVAALVAGMQEMAKVKTVWPDAEIIQLHPAQPTFEAAE